ncbi:MAG: NADH-quinone oxidoreductase subunit N [Longimicrobiales bacterium]
MAIDYSSQLHYVWALLPEIVLCIVGMTVLLLDVFQKGERSVPSSPAVAWLSLGGVVAAALANVWVLSLTETAVDGAVALDEFRVFANFLFLLGAALFILIGKRYLEVEGISLGELYSLALFAAVGMMLFAGTRDLILIFLGLELLSVAVYVLTAANRRDLRSTEGGLKYFLLGAFSSAFFIMGIALVYGGTGTVNLAGIARAIGADTATVSPLVLIGMGLLAVGFGFKVAAVPFHMWTPDAYEGAPAPITGYMAAAVKAAAFAAFLRVFLTAFGSLQSTWIVIVVWLAALTMVVANLIALVEGNVKRMLAYSSIAHAGYLLVALAAANTLGAASFLFYLVVYTLMTIGAFGVLLVLAGRHEQHLDLESYSGLGWRMPLLGTAMTIFLLSLAGFPFTGGFIGKVFILRAALERGLIALALLLVLTSLVSYFYYLRVAWYMWFRDPPDATEAPAPLQVTPSLGLALAVSVAGVLLLGIFPGLVLEAAERSALSLLLTPAPFVAGAP